MRRTRVPQTRLGREAVNDPRLVADLRKGRKLGPKLEARLRAYLERAQ